MVRASSSNIIYLTARSDPKPQARLGSLLSIRSFFYYQGSSEDLGLTGLTGLPGLPGFQRPPKDQQPPFSQAGKTDARQYRAAGLRSESDESELREYDSEESDSREDELFVPFDPIEWEIKHNADEDGMMERPPEIYPEGLSLAGSSPPPIPAPSKHGIYWGKLKTPFAEEPIHGLFEGMTRKNSPVFHFPGRYGVRSLIVSIVTSAIRTN